MAYSPGPWVVQPCQETQGEETVIADREGNVLAIIPSPAWDRSQPLDDAAVNDRDNAALMAGAFVLRNALKGLLLAVAQQNPTLHNAKMRRQVARAKMALSNSISTAEPPG